MSETSPSTNATVTFSNVNKTYQVGEVQIPALKNVSLSIARQKFTMVLGPSGSGKTTLLNLIGCLDQQSSGRIEVCGADIGKLTDDEISEFRARNIAFIFQNFNLIPVLSAYENVEYPLILLGLTPHERRERTRAMLSAVGLLEHADHRPNQLSGGQKQRVAIARALVKNPGLVLADEPTANLDSKTGAAIIELMHKIQEECSATFVFSTHDPQLISHAEEIYRIRDGEVTHEAPE